MRHILSGLAALALLASSGANAAGGYCGDLQNAFGPFDYRRRGEFVEQFSLVERAHFTEEVQRGIKGATGSIGADLDYTLRAIPNHPGALAVMGEVGRKLKMLKLPGAKYPVECYFDRAMRFQPNDGMARAAYANYLYSTGQDKKALSMFAEAAELAPNDATISYNAGLAYFKSKDYRKANELAQKAYKAGFPLPGLKNKLVEVGQWVALPDSAPAMPAPIAKEAETAATAAPVVAKEIKPAPAVQSQGTPAK